MTSWAASSSPSSLKSGSSSRAGSTVRPTRLQLIDRPQPPLAPRRTALQSKQPPPVPGLAGDGLVACLPPALHATADTARLLHGMVLRLAIAGRWASRFRLIDRFALVIL